MAYNDPPDYIYEFEFTVQGFPFEGCANKLV